jgi:hypothetical protein
MMVAVDQFPAMLCDLVLDENAPRREGAAADARVAFIDVGLKLKSRP